MKRAAVFDHLDASQREVADGAMRIRQQWDVLEQLSRSGHDTKNAEAMLRALLSAQARRVALQDRLYRACRRLH